MDKITVTQARPYREIPALSESDKKRFYSNVAKTESCWLWTGGSSGNRTHKYGDLSVGGKTFRAHRLSYVLARGEIPEGKVIDHLCCNPLCVNPDHLEAVSQGENTRRGRSYGTHCKRGHRLAGENIQWVGTQRRCRKCAAFRMRKWRASHRG